jgi:hypothetical protein
MAITEPIRQRLSDGLVIPACPLALNSRRRLDERRQRALFRYYQAAGAGGVAVGVHTTQFAIHDPKVGLFEPLLELAAATLSPQDRKCVLIAGICGRTKQAVAEALRARVHGFHAGLLSLAAFQDAAENELIQHCATVGKVLPIFGFYLQPAAGGRVLSYKFWRRFAEIDSLVAIKIAPFNRYQTLDVVRAIVESGRDDVALYTGNDDSILLDLLTPFRFERNGKTVERRIVGGLLGHWAVWTRKAVELHERCRDLTRAKAPVPQELLSLAGQVTDANAAFFDAAQGYAGCIPGLHEVLRRQGLLAGRWCLDPREKLSPGQLEEIRRVYRAYPHLNDDAFVAQNLDQWLRD